MFAWSNLLHHKQRQSDKTKAITKIFHCYTSSDQIYISRLCNCQKSIGYKRKIKNTAESEQCLFQSELRDINTC